jgi:histidyl-tRNA synthetase
LIETLGGKPAPGIGFGLGMERLMLMLEAAGIGAPSSAPDAFAVVPDPHSLPRVMPLLAALRGEGVSVVMNAGGGSLKSQFRRADASEAAFALIFGASELAAGEVAVKRLRGQDAGTQFTRGLADASHWAHELRQR